MKEKNVEYPKVPINSNLVEKLVKNIMRRSDAPNNVATLNQRTNVNRLPFHTHHGENSLMKEGNLLNCLANKTNGSVTLHENEPVLVTSTKQKTINSSAVSPILLMNDNEMQQKKPQKCTTDTNAITSHRSSGRYIKSSRTARASVQSNSVSLNNLLQLKSFNLNSGSHSGNKNNNPYNAKNNPHRRNVSSR